MITRKILVIEHNEFTLGVGSGLSLNTLETLIESDGLILWDNEGQWGMLTKVHLQELLRRWEMVQAHRKGYPLAQYIRAEITFTSATPVSPTVARALRLNR